MKLLSLNIMIWISLSQGQKYSNLNPYWWPKPTFNILIGLDGLYQDSTYFNLSQGILTMTLI